MEPEFPIFKPRYPLRTRLVMLLPTVLFFGMMCNVAFSIAHFPMFFWLLALAFGLFTSLIPFFVIREIRFPDEMVSSRIRNSNKSTQILSRPAGSASAWARLPIWTS